MNYASSWVTITGKVFVDEMDMNERIEEKFPDCVRVDDDGEREYMVTPEQEQEVFEELAREKISKLMPTDDPVKLAEVSIDLSSYQS